MMAAKPSRRRVPVATMAAIWLLTSLVAACAGAAPRTGGSVPAAAGGSVSADAAEASRAQWSTLVTAARQEGKLNLIGPTGYEFRSVVDSFEQQFSITVDLWPTQGAEIAPRIATEREAGQSQWDVYIGGTTTGLDALVPMGVFDPMEPYLVVPEVRDPTRWRGGELEFLDPGRQLFVMTPRQRAIIFFNTTQTTGEEFKSYRDLLDPKWQGRIVMDDPRKSGPGQATFTFFYLHPELGPDFIRALGRQNPQLLRDYRQEADAVGQGRYALLVGGNDYTVEPLIRDGVPIGIRDPREVREGSDTSPGSGSLAVFSQPPHPHAARLWLNWILSQEGQTAFARALQYISGRQDVPTDHTFAWRIPVPGSIRTYDSEAMAIKPGLMSVLTEVFGS